MSRGAGFHWSPDSYQIKGEIYTYIPPTPLPFVHKAIEENILRGAEEEAKQADLMLSLGTTMRVTPACDLVLMGREPLQLVIVNRQCTGFDEVCGREGRDRESLVRVFGDCDHVMREVMELLLTQQEREEWEAHREERREEYQRLRGRLWSSC